MGEMALAWIPMALLLALNYRLSWRMIKKARAARPPEGIRDIVLRDVVLTWGVLFLVIPFHLIPLPKTISVIAWILVLAVVWVALSRGRRRVDGPPAGR